MLSFEEYKNKLLQDPELKKEWDALDPEFQEIRKAYHEYQNDPDFHFINGKLLLLKTPNGEMKPNGMIFMKNLLIIITM